MKKSREQSTIILQLCFDSVVQNEIKSLSIMGFHFAFVATTYFLAPESFSMLFFNTLISAVILRLNYGYRSWKKHYIATAKALLRRQEFNEKLLPTSFRWTDMEKEQIPYSGTDTLAIWTPLLVLIAVHATYWLALCIQPIQFSCKFLCD